VFDAEGIATEWHLEQALWELGDANIVNMSVARAGVAAADGA